MHSEYTLTLTNEAWDTESFINILYAFMTDEESTILYLDYSHGCTNNTLSLMKLMFSNIIESKLKFDNDKEKNIMIITKPSHNGPIEPDKYSPVYKATDKYGEIKSLSNRGKFFQLLNAFYNSKENFMRIDIITIPKDDIKSALKEFNNCHLSKLKIKFPTNLEAHIYKDSYVYNHSRIYRGLSHLYKLGEKYPYVPTPPTTGSNAVKKTAGEIAWEKALNDLDSIFKKEESSAEAPEFMEEGKRKKEQTILMGVNNTPYHSTFFIGTKAPDPLHNYEFIYRYTNIEGHNEPTPPWYKQAVDVCEDLRINICRKLDNFIDSSDVNIYVQYRNNEFTINVYINKIIDELKKKIDSELAVSCLVVHGWGGMTLTYAEIKEVK